VTSDDDRAVAGAALALVATLSKQFGTFKLANELIDLGGVPDARCSPSSTPWRPARSASTTVMCCARVRSVEFSDTA
jgi:hypothetical protein